MAVHILHDPEYGPYGAAVLLCSTSDWAFGPLITVGCFDIPKHSEYRYPAPDIAQAFLDWLGEDPRHFDERKLESKWTDFIAVGLHLCEECSGVTVKTQPFCSPKCERDRVEMLAIEAEEKEGDLGRAPQV